MPDKSGSKEKAKTFQAKDGIVARKNINDPLFADAAPKCLPHAMNSQTASFEAPYAFF